MANHLRTTEQSTENPMECPTADATAHSVGYASTQVTHETLALDTDIYLLLWLETVPINDLSSIPSEDLGPFLNQEKDKRLLTFHLKPCAISVQKLNS